MKKQPNYFELDELAHTVAHEYGTPIGIDGSQTILNAQIDYLCDDSYQFIDLAFSSLRQWNIYTAGGRQTRRSAVAHSNTYVRVPEGILVTYSDKFLNEAVTIDTPSEVQRAMIEDYQLGKYNQHYRVAKAGPQRLYRLQGLLEALSIELSN